MTPIGLIAGNGIFPLLFARAARTRGRRVVAVAMRGETDAKIEEVVDAILWTRVGQIGRARRFFSRHEARQAAMAGGVDKRRLFGRARPDWAAMRLLARAALRADDSLLRALATFFEEAGIEIIASTEFLPETLAPQGTLTTTEPTQAALADLAYGLRAARALGSLDIGQTVVVKAGAVVALEAVEGTDACIRRAGLLCGPGAVVVKVAKPQQDMRFDVPAIGTGTLDSMQAAGATTLGIEAHRTLLLGGDLLRREADRRGIAIIGMTALS